MCTVYCVCVCVCVCVCYICIGIKPCVSSFGADQFTQGNIHTTEEKDEREHAITSFFHVFYFSINLGSTCSFIVTPLLRRYAGYPIAFGVPAVLLAIATTIFWSARKQYYRVLPTGSVLNQFAIVIKAAFKHKHLHKQRQQQQQQQQQQVLSQTDDQSHSSSSRPLPLPLVSHWLDAALLDPTVTSEQVHNTKSVMRVLPIFSILPVFWMLFDQQGSSWTLQAEEMERYGLQPEQIQLVNPVFIMILLPFMDKVIYPWTARKGIGFTPLKRIGVGMLFSTAAFVCSWMVQSKIDDADEKNSVSLAWQLPQYFFISAGEVLISVTGLEFSYTQAPAKLKSVLTSLFLLSTAIGNLVTGAL